jgi:hypothetical protein
MAAAIGKTSQDTFQRQQGRHYAMHMGLLTQRCYCQCLQYKGNSAGLVQRVHYMHMYFPFLRGCFFHATIDIPVTLRNIVPSL